MTKIRKVPNATEKLVYYSLNGMEFRASHPPKCREFYVIWGNFTLDVKL